MTTTTTLPAARYGLTEIARHDDIVDSDDGASGNERAAARQGVGWVRAWDVCADIAWHELCWRTGGVLVDPMGQRWVVDAVGRTDGERYVWMSSDDDDEVVSMMPFDALDGYRYAEEQARQAYRRGR